MKAVVDRIEEDYAVLLIGEEEARVDFPKHLLPRGVGEGAWLELNITHDPDAEAAQRQKISSLLDKLKNKHKPRPD